MKKAVIKKKLVILSVLTLVLISGCVKPQEKSSPTNITGNVKIANWNLQIFGVSKASNETLLNFYADTIDDYDIIFVQEIRDVSGESFDKLCNKLPEYSCKISSRAGRSTSKEQYGLIYKKGIELTLFEDYNPDNADRWERPPIEVEFLIKNTTYTIFNIHTKPSDVPNEMKNLETIVTNKENTIILGDLNADCSYYDNSKEPYFDNWTWVIKDDEDTTVADTDCAYDRIILNVKYYNYGIYSQGITKDVSDHYLIWVEI